MRQNGKCALPSSSLAKKKEHREYRSFHFDLLSIPFSTKHKEKETETASNLHIISLCRRRIDINALLVKIRTQKKQIKNKNKK